MRRPTRLITRRSLSAAALAPALLAAGVATNAAGPVAAAPAASGPVAAAAPAAANPAAVTVTTPVLAGDFMQPVAVASPRDGSKRLFVVEKAGTIQVVNQDTGVRLGEYADITSRIDPSGEQGLLGIAFNPAFKTNPFVYLAFVSNQDQALRVVRFRPTGNTVAEQVESNTLDVTSGMPVIGVPHPTSADNHYAGTIAFGPDGLLYISTGDGGTTPQNAQNLWSLSGKILRIDPRRSEAGKPYAIPAGNPFRYGRYGRPEIWLWGLRNPFRFSIDFYNGNVWVADVGQQKMEEVSVRKTYQSGANLQWDCREGTMAYAFSRSTCPGPGPQLGPRIAYGRGFGESITGGNVYRGAQFPALQGLYVFADFQAPDKIVLHNPDGPVGNLTPKPAPTQGAVGFGEGDGRELFFVAIFDGTLRRVEGR